MGEEIQRAFKDIDNYDDKTQAKIRSAIRSGTENIMRGAKSRIRVHTGNLMKSVKMEYDAAHNRGFVKSDAPHAHLLEKGTRAAFIVPKRKKALLINGKFYASAFTAAKKARPFMKPAFDEEKPKVIKAVEEAIKP
jgi:HK97 gp10 family phage protein